MAVMCVLGCGLGNCMQPLLLILQSAVPPRDIGVATQLGDLLPPDRRHARRRGLPVDPVRPASAATSRTRSRRVADARVVQPRCTTRRSWRTRSTTQSPSRSSTRARRRCPRPGARTTPRSSSRMHAGARAPVQGRVRRLDGHRCSCSPGCVGVLAFLILLLMPKVELRATSASAAVRTEGAAAAAPVDGPGLD